MGADHTYSLIAGEEMGRVSCGGVPMAMAVQMSMSTPALARYGSHELKEQYLAPAIRGEVVTCHRRDRARRRQRRRGHPHQGRARRRRVGHQRLQALHHQRHAGGLALPPGPDLGRAGLPLHVAHRGPDRAHWRRGVAQAREARHVVERHGGAVLHRRARARRQHHRRDRPRLPAADGPVPGRAPDDLLQAGRVDRAGPRAHEVIPPGAPRLRRPPAWPTSTCSSCWPSWPPATTS